MILRITHARTTILAGVLLTVVITASLAAPLLQSDAISGSKRSDEGRQRERKLELKKLGFDLPVEITQVRNLQSEHWLRDLEIEIRNTSDKPIYYVKLMLILPDAIVNRSSYGVSLRYGRQALIDISERAKPGDVALEPGESYVFKVDSSLWSGFEHFRAQRNLSNDATKRVQVRFQTINFGDGTGYVSGGVPVPAKTSGLNRSSFPAGEDRFPTLVTSWANPSANVSPLLKSQQCPNCASDCWGRYKDNGEYAVCNGCPADSVTAANCNDGGICCDISYFEMYCNGEYACDESFTSACMPWAS